MWVDAMEEMTVEFLRKNDPLFYKKNKIEYKYLSDRMHNDRKSKEIPASNLSKRQKGKCPKMSDSFVWD